MEEKIGRFHCEMKKCFDVQPGQRDRKMTPILYRMIQISSLKTVGGYTGSGNLFPEVTLVAH